MLEQEYIQKLTQRLVLYAHRRKTIIHGKINYWLKLSYSNQSSRFHHYINYEMKYFKYCYFMNKRLLLLHNILVEQLIPSIIPCLNYLMWPNLIRRYYGYSIGFTVLQLWKCFLPVFFIILAIAVQRIVNANVYNNNVEVII